jgi:hypothetical protein
MLLLFLLGFVVGTMVHEYGHLFAYRVYGVDCIIKQGNFNHVYPTLLLPEFEQTVAYLAGGFTVAVVYLVFFLLTEDGTLRVALETIIVYQFIYALFEGFAPWNYLEVGGFIGMLVGVAVPCLLMLSGRLEPSI